MSAYSKHQENKKDDFIGFILVFFIFYFFFKILFSCVYCNIVKPIDNYLKKN